MRQILFIDELEKLNVKKDSSLLLALELQRQGFETWLLFKSDFYYSNLGTLVYKVYSFSGDRASDSYYIDRFELGESRNIEFEKGDVLHMRLDPPFDSRYLRYLWMLQSLEGKGIVVINSPTGIMNHNEKLYAYDQPGSIESYVGESLTAFERFANGQKEKGIGDLILKPLDLFQGIGVRKVSLESKDLNQQFLQCISEFSGPVIAQPFCKDVTQGEIRTIFYKGEELGTILKKPAAGNFLANVASGASYNSFQLPADLFKECRELSLRLSHKGVDWIAYDILSGSISEINITCPGLLVEVAEACKNNLLERLVQLMTNKNP